MTLLLATIIREHLDYTVFSSVSHPACCRLAAMAMNISAFGLQVPSPVMWIQILPMTSTCMFFMFMVPCIIIFYEITNRCNHMQSILFQCQVHSTCFGRHTHPSSGVQCSTVSTVTGTNHSIVTATCSQCGLALTMVCTSGCRYS